MCDSVLYIHDGFLNPGDAFSFCGARFFINKSIDVVYEQSISIENSKNIPSRLGISGPDLLAFTGAPWLWDQCANSKKYSAAYALLQMSPNVKKIAIGVGSCFLGLHTKSLIESIVLSERDSLSAFWRMFDAIIVRDILAWWILSLLGIDSILAPCPSIAVGDWYGRTHAANGMVILSEPLEKNFVYSYIPQEDRDYYKKRVEQLTGNHASIIQWILLDRSTIASRSVKTICKSIEAAKASTFFTARVHAALVAMGMGLHGELLALDSRALSAQLYGAELVGSQAEIFCELAGSLKESAPAVVDIGDAIKNHLGKML